MMQGIGVVGIYVRDQEEALSFYVGRLGFQVHTDASNGGYRWLTVHHPDQPDFQLGLFRPQPPTVDAATAAQAWSSRRNRWHASAAWTRASAIRPGTDGS